MTTSKTEAQVMDANGFLLRISLEAAVPLWMERAKGMPDEYLLRVAGKSGTVLGAKGDILMFGGHTNRAKREVAETFNELAHGLACVALLQGWTSDEVVRKAFPPCP